MAPQDGLFRAIYLTDVLAGRNRRYYSTTEKGSEKLEEYRHQWREYEQKVNTVLFGEAHT